MEDNLYCPITGELFEDPITVPCGKSFSRQALLTWLVNNNTCPECRNDLSNFDAVNAAPNRSLIYIVDAYKNPNKVQTNQHGHTWNVELTPITTNDKSSANVKTSILPNSNLAQLQLSVQNAKYAIRPVLNEFLVDVSYSMSNAWPQVKSALLYIMGVVSTNPMMKTVIIPYDSIAEGRAYTLTGDISKDEPKINNMFTSGGTHFRNAFIEAGKILQKYKCSDAEQDQQDPMNVSSANIFFMTDGQDCGDKSTLKQDFDNIINSTWKGPYTVHTIGFSSNCDRNTLENIRSKYIDENGQEDPDKQGTFRYADPNDDADTLCNKLQSLFDMASKSTSADVKIKLPTGITTLQNQNEVDVKMPINPLQQGSYTTWVKILDNNDIQSLTINTQLEDNYQLDIKLNPASNDIYNKWLAVVLDQLATELLELSKLSKGPSDKARELHCSLILYKLEKLAGKCSDTDRITFLTEQCNYLKNGGTMDINRLSDMRFSSRFTASVVKSSGKPKTNPNNNYQPYVAPKIKQEAEWPERNVYYTHNNNIKDLNRNELQRVIMQTGYENQLLCNDRKNHTKTCNCAGQRKLKQQIKQELDKCSLADITYQDGDGNNAVMLAAYCGYYLTVKEILSKFDLTDFINIINKDDETALTLAIKKQGYYKTMNLLLEQGALIPTKRLKGLQKYALSEGYKQTGEFLAAEGMDVTNADESMTPAYIQFMYSKAKKDNKKINKSSYFTAALKYAIESTDMLNIVTDLLTDIKFNIDMLKKYAMPPKPDYPEVDKYIELNKLLLKANPNLLTDKNDKEDTALIMAVESGNLPLVEFFLDQGADLEEVNDMGNSALWIAAAMKWPCIVDELINRGADPNHVNIKGNGPLYASCLCGPRKIAEALILAGADPEHRNNNNDTLVLSCCRNGQPEVLELLLEQVDPELVKHRPEVDGFNAVMAAAETKSKNGAACLQVLHDNDVDLNEKTADDNSLLPGSTALHIAAHYNNLIAIQKLLELGADINAVNIHGQTALHMAVIQGNLEIIKILRNTKIVADNSGNTPVAYCRNNTDIRKMLINPLYDILLQLSKGTFNEAEQNYALNILSEKCEIVGCLTTAEVVNISPDFLITAIIYRNFKVIELYVKMGADPITANNYGVTAMTIVKWLNNAKIKKLINCEVQDEAYHNLKVAANNMTNKAILSLISKPKAINDLTDSGISVRMTELINDVNKVENLVPRLEGASDKSAIDVFKKAKIDNYDNYVWHARLHTINVIANYEKLLTPAEVLALSLYTNNSELAVKVNQAILDRNNNPWIYPYAQQLLTGLDKLPNYQSEVFIGAENVNRSVFMVDNEISWSTLRSASTMWRVATEQVPNFVDGKKRHGTIFIVKCNTAKLVSRYSQFNIDSEVLIRPGTKFKVRAWYQPAVIALEQENIREYSYGIKPEQRAEYLTHRSLIVELTEM